MQLPKDVTLRVITTAERAACVHVYWLPRHVWHMPLKGHVLVPDWPVLYLKMFLLCDSGIDGIVHSASLCGLTLNGCTLSHS